MYVPFRTVTVPSFVVAHGGVGILNGGGEGGLDNISRAKVGEEGEPSDTVQV
jgi:hypothetical protein